MKSLKKFDEKKIDVDTRTEVSNQFSKYLLTFILESNDKTPAYFSCRGPELSPIRWQKITSQSKFNGGSPGKNFKSEASRMCGAKRSEAKPPTIRLRRDLKIFPGGPHCAPKSKIPGFQGVFLFSSPGHLPKKPSPFTHFFMNFHISPYLFTAFPCWFFRNPNDIFFPQKSDKS